MPAAGMTNMLSRLFSTPHTCPICEFHGPFRKLRPETGVRPHAECPRCGALERHRLQYLVLERLSGQVDFSRMRMLHFAPETFFMGYFKERVKDYKTADLNVPEVDYRVDLTQLPFGDGEFDFIFASHVLEHIQDDAAAVSEIRRVLAPGGVAILPVPVVSSQTVEYPAPNPAESDHVRAPGFDYFDRYRKFFASVNLFTSDDFPEQFQTYVYEDRSRYPTAKIPLRAPMPGRRHIDVVPVCRA